MDLDEVIKKRVSIRKYEPKPVPLDKIAALLDAARTAPNSGNLQEFRFIIVNNKEVKNKVAEASLRQFWMNSAPIFIVICSDIGRLENFYKDRAKDYSLQNSAVAATLISLKAIDLGLSTCWVNVFDQNVVSRVLGIRSNIKPQIIMTLGYADEKPKKKFSRIPLNRITFFNSYDTRIIKLKEWAKERYLDKIKKLFS